MAGWLMFALAPYVLEGDGRSPGGHAGYSGDLPLGHPAFCVDADADKGEGDEDY